jgi:hypothetical protein
LAHPRPAWILALAFALLSAVFLVVHQSDRRLVAALAARLDAGRQLTSEQRLALYTGFAHSELGSPRYEDLHPRPVRLYYRFNPLHPGPGDVLRWGPDYRGTCGSRANVTIALLQQRGVPARHLFLLDERGRSIHDVVEARIDGTWVVADANYGIVYRRPDGSLATAADLASKPALFHAHVDTIADYDRRYTYESVAHMNWGKIPVLLPAFRGMLERVLGRDRVAEIQRPGIWMWPWAFYSVAWAVLAVFAAAVALRGSSRAKVRPPR